MSGRLNNSFRADGARPARRNTIAARLREADWEGELYGWLNPAASVR